MRGPKILCGSTPVNLETRPNSIHGALIGLTPRVMRAREHSSVGSQAWQIDVEALNRRLDSLPEMMLR